MHIRSSWNEDRIAACLTKSARVRRARDPHKGWFANYTRDEVAVRTPRGRVVFKKKMPAVIASAILRGGTCLNVETVDGACYVFDADTGTLLAGKPAALVVADAPKAACGGKPGEPFTQHAA